VVGMREAGAGALRRFAKRGKGGSGLSLKK